MKLKIDAPVCGIDGQPVEPRTTVGEIIGQAMLATLPMDQQKSGPYKFKLFKIAQQCAGSEAEIEIDDGVVEIIRDRVGVAFNALAVGAIYQALGEE